MPETRRELLHITDSLPNVRREKPLQIPRDDNITLKDARSTVGSLICDLNGTENRFDGWPAMVRHALLSKIPVTDANGQQFLAKLFCLYVALIVPLWLCLDFLNCRVKGWIEFRNWRETFRHEIHTFSRQWRKSRQNHGSTTRNCWRQNRLVSDDPP